MSFFNHIKHQDVEAYQKGLLKSHYDEVENMYSEMRTWRHNYRNHLQTMKSYAASGDLEAICKYLDELDGELSSLESSIKTGNKMTDAIMNSKISLARSQNIQVICDAHVAVALTIPELDLCTIIGNLFDNAIEASLELPEEQRMIRIYMDMKNTQLYISFTNITAQKKQRKINGIFTSTKGKNHGLGLASIDRLVEVHGGYLSRNSEDGAFTTEILLPQ
jgi:sensor histidine kinase regulating citrate/malate metabolism